MTDYTTLLRADRNEIYIINKSNEDRVILQLLSKMEGNFFASVRNDGVDSDKIDDINEIFSKSQRDSSSYNGELETRFNCDYSEPVKHEDFVKFQLNSFVINSLEEKKEIIFKIENLYNVVFTDDQVNALLYPIN